MQFSFCRSLIVLSLSTVSFAQVLTVPAKPAPSGQSAPAATPAPATSPAPAEAPPQIDPAARDKVIADLRVKKFDDALTEAKAILAGKPESSQANKLVGIVLLDKQKGSEAVPYFQKAQALDAQDTSVHALLVQAYAQSGDKKGRDEQRAILRGYHSDGKHPDFGRAKGYLIETIPVDDKVIQAIEFYEPSGKYHFYYRFNVYDAAGKLHTFLTLESDDADQAMYAQQHPKEAAAGDRRFSIDSYSQGAQGAVTQGLLGFLDGQPTYDDLRDRIVKAVQNNTPPSATTTISPGTPAPAAPPSATPAAPPSLKSPAPPK